MSKAEAIKIPGLSLLAKLPSNKPIDEMFSSGGFLYARQGVDTYRVDSKGKVSLIVGGEQSDDA